MNHYRFQFLAPIGLVLALIGCGAGTNQPKLDFDAHAAGGVISVVGATDLPDNSKVRINAWMDGVAAAVSNGEVTVRNGAFQYTQEVATWPAGTVNVTADLVVDAEQPKSVRDLYGANGERLSGPNVFDDSGDPKVRIWKTIANESETS